LTQRKAVRDRPLSRAERARNRWTSRVRAKVCYRGLAKNTHRLVVACALANLFIARHRVLRGQEA